MYVFMVVVCIDYMICIVVFWVNIIIIFDVFSVNNCFCKNLNFIEVNLSGRKIIEWNSFWFLLEVIL